MSNMPSREFFVQQACLNVNTAYTWSLWWEAVERAGPVNWIGTHLLRCIREEYAQLVSEWENRT